MARHIVGSILNDLEIAGINDNFLELYNDLGTATGTKQKLEQFLNGTGVVTNAMLADDSVDGDKIAQASIFSPHLRLGAVGERELATGGVSSSKIRNDAVNELKIQDGAVTKSKIANLAVDTEHYAAGSITEDKIGGHAVNQYKIAPESVTESKLGNRSVSSRTLALRSVTDAHLEIGSVIADIIGPHAVNQFKIAPEAVTESKFGNNSVSNRALALRAVESNNIAFGGVQEENVADEAISAAKTSFDALSLNKGKAYPLKNLGTNYYAMFEDSILDIQVFNAKENRVYRPESLLKDWVYNEETFTGVQIQYKEDDGSWNNLILRGSQDNISNNQTGVQTHLISDPDVDERFLVTMDWDAVSTGITRIGSVDYIIDESKYNYESADKNNVLYGKKGVAFGDSITQGGEYPDYISARTGADYINVGFGSTRLARVDRPDYPWSGIGMCELTDAITTGDWTATDAAIAEIDAYYGNTTYSTIYNRLKEIDFNTVDFLTFMYGTNDANNSVFEIGVEDSADTYTVNGALNHIFQEIMSTYPHIKVYALSPIFRQTLSGWGDGDSDDSKLADGVYLYDIAQAILDRAKTYHTPSKDMYNESGINRHNASYFLKDGVHPGEEGLKLMNDSIYKFLLSY